MSFKKNFVLGIISGLALSAASNAYAISTEVIYKIHDINPVKEDGEVTECAFITTFFNRSYMPVTDVSIDIGWKDDVVEDRIKTEKKEKTYDSEGAQGGYDGQSKTEKFTSKMISANMSVPPLQPGKQISVKASVKSDRCFLLLDKPEIIVRSCNYGDEGNDKTAGVCKNMFKFISPQNSEYYSEFSDISYDSQKKQAQEESNGEQKELNQLYNNAINSVKRTTEALKSMQ